MCVEVKGGFSNLPISAQALSVLEVCDGCMHCDPEHIEAVQQMMELVCPTLLFHDVLHEKVKACIGEDSNGSMEAFEKRFSVCKADVFTEWPKS